MLPFVNTGRCESRPLFYFNDNSQSALFKDLLKNLYRPITPAPLFTEKRIKRMIQAVSFHLQQLKDKKDFIPLTEGEWEDHFLYVKNLMENKELVDSKTKRSQQILIELAALDAQHNGEGVSKNIQNYGIEKETPEGQQALIEIAKIAAQQNGLATSEHIKNFGINKNTPEGQQALIEIAKLAAKQNGSTSCYIQNYGINNHTLEGQQALIEIAKIAAQQDGEATSFFIKRYGINKNTPAGQQALIEIALLAAQQNGAATSEYIQNYGIADSKALYEIFGEAVLQNFRSLSCIKNYKLELEEEVYSNFSLKIENCSSQTKRLLQTHCNRGLSEAAAAQLQQQADAVKDDHALENLKKALSVVIYLSTYCKANEAALTELSHEIDSLLAIRNQSLRSRVARTLGVQIIKEGFGTKGATGPFLLPAMYLAILKRQGAPSAEELLNQTKSLKSESKNLVFKDYRARDALLHALDIMVSTKTTSSQQKGRLLKCALDAPSKENCLRMLRAIINIHHLADSLAPLESAVTSDDFSQRFCNAFQNAVPIPPIDNFSEKFEKMLEDFRDPFALYTYAGALAKLPPLDRRISMEAFAVFVSEVLEGKTSQRYEDSPHLEQIFKSDPELKNKWIQGDARPLLNSKQTDQQTAIQIALDFTALVKRSIQERHAEGTHLPFLFAYIAAEDDEDRNRTVKNLEEAKKNSPEISLLIFQEYLLEIMRTTNQFQANSILDICLKNIPSSIPSNSQFIADLKRFHNALNNKPVGNMSKWQIVDTDNPCDLTLLGTEAEGSCQNISGDPEFNKCLLAYLLDGKNRLLAIKDEKGVIQARAILRLLWDGEKPVLFLERIYPDILDEKLKDHLIDFAKERATALGLDLLSKETGSGDDYSKTLHSLGGRAPFEYVDAGNGIYTGSDWSIQVVHILQPAAENRYKRRKLMDSASKSGEWSQE